MILLQNGLDYRFIAKLKYIVVIGIILSVHIKLKQDCRSAILYFLS